MGSVRTVGLIGVGRMGRPVCGHLLRSGIVVRMYDIDPRAMEPVVALGGSACASAGEAADGADAIVIMLGFYPEIEQTLLGPDGVLSRAKPGSVVVLSSTISPDEAKFLASCCHEAGIGFVDAPVCMGEAAAIDGSLVWLVGGTPDEVEQARPFLEPSGPQVFHLGAVGAGMVGKCVNNMIMWSAIVANDEGFELARRYGVDSGRLITALLQTSAMNYPMKVWRPAKVPWAHKDMTIVLDMADRADLIAPVAALLREQVKGLVAESGARAFTPRTQFGGHSS